MSPVMALLLLLAVYLAIGLLVGLRFVLSTIRRADPVAAEAPLRVRLLFLPGAVAVWPLVLRRTRLLTGSTERQA